MAEPSGRERHRSGSEDVEEQLETEKVLARVVGAALPVLCVTSAVVVGFVAGAGPAILVLAFGALVGTIALLWASLRTLSGDAPLPAGLERATSQSHGASALTEHKRRVLRALKDLESEHAIGKIDDADYDAISLGYREEAKSVMRKLDEEVAPSRVEAEKLALEYVARQALGAKVAGKRPRAAKPAERVVCASCKTSNEPDATFCKQCGSAMPIGEGKAHATK
jgi:rRNA maturation endonuclease Nob1